MKKLLIIAAIPVMLSSCLSQPSDNIEQVTEYDTKVDTVYSHSIDTVYSQKFDTTYAVEMFYSIDTGMYQKFDTTYVIDTLHTIDSRSMKSDVYSTDTIISNSIDTLIREKECMVKHRAIRNLITEEVTRSKTIKCKLDDLGYQNETF